jgi:tetratricopeptide (TPR) repeat protein
MGKYKICVYAISKNEEKFVDRWMDAVSEADEVIVTDTGSEDGTVERLKTRGAKVYVENILPWRFDEARNMALSHVPEDADICVSNDLDEVFQKGWREKLENSWTPECTSARYMFTWSYNLDGTPNKQYTMEKIHRRKDFKWVHAVHEVLEYTGCEPEKTAWINGMVLNHYPDVSKQRSSYLPLLELAVVENPQDDRNMFWLGREYMYYGQYDQCIATLKRHLELSSAQWDDERSASYRFMAEAYKAKENVYETKRCLYKAIAECPTVREPYLHMARLGYELNEWLLVYCMVDSALRITEETGSYLMEPDAWDYHLYDLGAIACYWIGMGEKAIEYADMAITMEPEDQRLKDNAELIRKKFAYQG